VLRRGLHPLLLGRAAPEEDRRDGEQPHERGPDVAEPPAFRVQGSGLGA
jgi:hypothetical protein